MPTLYLLIDFCTILVPFIFSFHPKIKFAQKHLSFLWSNLIVAAIFIAWDMFFTFKGVWGFNPRYVIGTYVGNLPIEEILFFICIPYSCVFTFYTLSLYLPLKMKRNTESIFVLVISTFLIVVGLYFFNRAYTSVTFITTALLLLYCSFIAKVTWIGQLFKVYPILLIPFFIVNGILTGTGLDQPVVWYNNNENLAIRILTIPIEDIVYGFELILLNILGFNYFARKSNTIKLATKE